MALFKRREEEEWNIWDDEELEELSYDELTDTDSSYNNSTHTHKTLLNGQPHQNPHKSPLKHFSRHTNKSNEILENPNEVINYLDGDGQIYDKDDNKIFISFKKVALFVLVVFVGILGGIGYLNTDFDENNTAYIVSYDIHYERDYVKCADEVLNYCIDLYEKMPELMLSIQSNTITVSTELNDMRTVLEAKTNNLSRYTEVPEMMSTYNNDLISFSLSTQEMMLAITQNYASGDYIYWAEAAYTDFENSLNNLKVLRGQINTIIYRNVYGGSE